MLDITGLESLNHPWHRPFLSNMFTYVPHPLANHFFTSFYDLLKFLFFLLQRNTI
jgi:hypothetical protein